MAEALPSIDDVLGPEPEKAALPSVDDVLDAKPEPVAMPAEFGGYVPASNAETDHWLAQSSIGRVLDAIGQGAKTGFGSEEFGLGAESTEALKKAGILPDVQKHQGGIMRAFNEAFIRPAAALLDAAMRAGAAGLGAYQAGAAQIGEEIGAPGLGRDVAAMPEAFFGSPGGLHGPRPVKASVVRAVPSVVTRPLDLPAAKDFGVIGRPRAAWEGVDSPALPDAMANDDVRGAARTELGPVRAATEPALEPEAEPAASVTPQAPADVHEAARQIAPDTFKEYDELTAHRDSLRQQIAEAQDTLKRAAEAQAPGRAEIADLERRMEDATPRLAKKYQARLDALQPAHDAFLADKFTMGALTRDTEEISSLRNQFLETDYRMRDLAPDVTDAYRQAATQFPKTEPVGEPAAAEAAVNVTEPPATSKVLPVTEPAIATAEPGMHAGNEITEITHEPAKASAARAAIQPVASIVDDVADKLRAAGRPTEEVDAAARVTEAMWRTRADAFEGRKGTAEEMYSREAPDIRPGRDVNARQLELAQSDSATRAGTKGKIKLTEDGRSVITLMRSANASTYIHEMGHDWLERMMRDAVDADAPEAMRKDAATVRAYLGLNDGDAITTKVHEKFARSFERYFMEGRAPTQALADVFAKFRNWLTRIYQSVSNLRAPITADIRDVFDRLLTRDPEATLVPESATDAARETAEPKPVPTPFEPEPAEPKRLTTYLREQGGIRDTGGDIRSVLGGAKYRPGLINNGKRGLQLDWAAKMAHDAGYLPEAGGSPEISHLINALEEDLKSSPARYSQQDSDIVDHYHETIARNDEVSRLADEHEIDPTGLTRDQFFDKVAEKVAAADREALMQSLKDKSVDAFNEAVDAAREWSERDGEEWDSDAFHGIDAPRTLEDLERENDVSRSADAARSDFEGKDNAGDGRSSAGDQGVSEEGQGRGRGGNGDAGGVRQAGGGPSAERSSGREALRPTAEDIIDKAGNIRLDNLNTEEDINHFFREAALRNDDFLAERRGVVTDADRIRMADALGADPAFINDWKVGDTFNAEQMEWTRRAFVQMGGEIRDLAAKALVGGSAEALEFAQMQQRLVLLQGKLSGATAEWGRAGRALRMLKDASKDISQASEALYQATGRTLFQKQREAKAAALMETSEQVNKFTRDAAKPGFWDKAFFVYVNGLISNPITHKVYAEANMMMALWKAVPERAVAAALGMGREALGIKGERVFFGEVGAELSGLMSGQMDGIRAAYRSAKSGLTEALPGEADGQANMLAAAGPYRPIGGAVGAVIAAPGERMVAPIHSYFRSIGYSQAIAGLAYREASSAGLSGNALMTRVAEIKMNPSDAMMAAARDAATTQTLMSKGGVISQKVANFVRDVPGLRWIDPFVKISSNITAQALLERSPLGLAFPDIRDNIMGRNGSIARDEQIARMAVGTSLGVTAVYFAQQGLITGGGPADSKQMAMWRMDGNQPFSVRIGDTWYQTKRLGVLGKILGIAADFHELHEQMQERDSSKVATAIVGTLSHALIDDSFMQGPSELISTMLSPARNEDRYVSQWINGLIPFSSAVRQVTRLTDPTLRDARSILDRVKSSIPFVSQTLEPRNDIFGQPIVSGGLEPVTSVAESTVRNDSVVAAMMRLNIFPGPMPRKVVGIDLTPAQYEEMTRTGGRLAKRMLDAQVNQPGFSSMPDGIQSRVIMETMAKARHSAEELIKAQNPDIIRQALENKRNLLIHGRPPR